MAIGTTTAIIGSALVSAGASAFSASKQAGAAKSAANAQAAAAGESIQLQREQMEKAEGLNQPYISRGNVAQARLDALYGLPGGFSGGSGQSYLTGGTGGDTLGTNGIPQGSVPDWNGYWSNVTGGKSLQQHAAGDAAFQRHLAQARAAGDTRSDAQIHYDYGGNAAGPPPYVQDPNAPAAAGPTYAEALDPFYNTYQYKQAGESYTGTNNLIDQGYADIAGQLSANRADLEARYGADFATRKGYTDTAIEAYDQVSEEDRRRAQLQLQAQGLGSGQLGKWARANAGEASYQAAKYGDTIRTYRNQDYNPYAEGMEQAASSYGTGSLQNKETRNNRYLTNWSNYGDDKLRAYGDYTGYLKDAADTGYNARQNVVSGGQTAANNIGGYLQQGADARAQGAYNNANIWGAAGKSVAETVGGAWDSYNKQKSIDPFWGRT